MTTRMSCSMRSSVVPSPRMRSSSARSPLVSEAFIPAAGSSSASKTGSVAPPRDLQAPLIAVGKAPGRIVRPGADADVVEQLRRAPLDSRFLGARRPIAQHGAENARVRADVAADHDVFESRQIGEEPDVLES